MRGGIASTPSSSRRCGRTWRASRRRRGVVSTAYERRYGASSRVHQFALVYLLNPTSGVYSCPLAMTDGAAKTLVTMGNEPLLDRALPRLLSRDPKTAWTTGQWMTERTGGSDVGHLGDGRSRCERERRLPSLRHQVVHQRHHLADDPQPLARPEGKSCRAVRAACALLSRAAERGRLDERRRHQSAQGQARHAHGALLPELTPGRRARR